MNSVQFAPTTKITEAEKDMIIECVYNAITNPYTILDCWAQ